MIRRFEPFIDHAGEDHPGVAEVDIAPRADLPPLSIEDWLALLRRMLHVSEPSRRVICEELEGHLRERVRDLMLAGVAEARAIRCALDELGEVAALAQRFQSATHSRRRRIIMNTVLAGFGVIVVAAGVTVVNQSSQQTGLSRPSVFQPADSQLDRARLLDEVPLDVRVEMSPREILDAVVATERIGVSVDWGRLEEAGIVADEPFGLSSDGSVLLVLQEMQRRGDDAGEPLDWRLVGNHLTIDTRSNFDFRERSLASYEIGDILEAMNMNYSIEHDDAVVEVSTLISDLVEPELWRENGGDLAQMRVVNGRMFIVAPPRMHERIAWMLDELRQERRAMMHDVPESHSDSGAAVPPAGHAAASTLHPGAKVTVEVFELFEVGEWYSITRVLDATGDFRLPLVGEIPAAGATIAEFEQRLQHALSMVAPNAQAVVLLAGERSSATGATEMQDREPALGIAGRQAGER